MIAVDTNILLYLFHGDTSSPIDQITGTKVDRCRDRVDLLISTLSKTGTKLLLPTPAITEALVRTGAAASSYLDILRERSVFRIADFDQRAAIECSALIAQHWKERLKDLRVEISRHRIKFDLQIIAIARVAGVSEIVSDDPGVKNIAAISGMTCRGIADLPLPNEPDQGSFRGL